jgi:homospermidine synthase
MIKFLITLLLLLALFIFFKKSKFFVNKDSINTINSSNYGEIKKEYLIECKLNNEIIDRSIRDSERQCFYKCDEDDIIRVDTSIEYVCQPFILEKR